MGAIFIEESILKNYFHHIIQTNSLFMLARKCGEKSDYLLKNWLMLLPMPPPHTPVHMLHYKTGKNGASQRKKNRIPKKVLSSTPIPVPT